jgi:hypothetical protein
VKIRGPIVGLDLGRKTGFAIGLPGETPRSLSINLNKGKGGRSVTFGNLIGFLDGEFRKERPALVVKEAPVSLQAFKTLGMGEAVVRGTYALHGIVEGLCARWKIPCREEHDATVRKHFIGKGRLGKREATKAAVISRCWQLGYLPRGEHDEDRADACAVWDWACAHVAMIAPKELFLFEVAA